MSKNVFYTMDHRGGLKEALATLREIDKATFNKLVKYYDYYCFDDRILSVRFILKDLPNMVLKNYPTWLLISFKDIPEVFGDDPLDSK